MSAEELAAMDAKIVADTIAEMQRQIEQLTGARHSMYDPAVAIARDIANRTPPAMSADHIGEAQGWRDIATAPRDGTMLLVGYDEGVAREGAMEDRQRVFEARWNDVQGTWSARNGFLLHSDATHWQPLPHPPSAHPAPIKPSVDTGELREKMKRAIWTQLPQEDANMGTSGRIADAILGLIQSERAGSPIGQNDKPGLAVSDAGEP